ncbi:GNAT family N-acetyltransferase [Psychromonas sp. GE-S-Ul-11]|uniref:GNAT family N-acetyltransferase n=1 Tax=Psychromonas sp. GE-S-Ul-11 TaxID=3241170 RepID=UPI00390C7F5B
MDVKTLQCGELDKLQIPLVNQFYKQVYKKGAANKSERVFVLKTNQIICAARLKEVDGNKLLTGVACDPAYRHQGLASQLIQYILRLQTETVYCFPYPHLQRFYQQLGFQLLSAELLPTKLAEQYSRYNNRTPLLSMSYKVSNSTR